MHSKKLHKKFDINQNDEEDNTTDLGIIEMLIY